MAELRQETINIVGKGKVEIRETDPSKPNKCHNCRKRHQGICQAIRCSTCRKMHRGRCWYKTTAISMFPSIMSSNYIGLLGRTPEGDGQVVDIKWGRESKTARFHGVVDDETASRICSYTVRGSAAMRNLVYELEKKRKEKLGKGISEEAGH